MTIDEFKKKVAPHMRHGWVAMDKNEDWFWYSHKPDTNTLFGSSFIDCLGDNLDLLMFDIEPVDNWQESLIEVGNESK